MKNCNSYRCLQSIRYLLFASVIVLATHASISAKDFPIQASVTSAKASIHSGPAKVHYATDRLAKGTMVEVYRLDPDGWCAIRPPKRSFSIVPSELVKQSSADLGTIIEDKVPAWVGTLLGSVSDPMWQVQLNKNEEVEILGLIESGSDQGSGKQSWFQIRPPAGEFRWIHIDNLSVFDKRQIRVAAGIESPSRHQISKNTQRNNKTSADRRQQRKNIPTQPIPAEPWLNQNAATTNHSNEITDNSSGNDSQYPVTTANFQENGGWRPARQPIQSFENDSLSNPYDSSSLATGTTTSIPTTPLDSDSNSFQDVNNRSINTSNWNSNDSLNSQPSITGSSLQDLDLALSNEMLKQPTQWNLEPLRQQVQRALANPDSTLDRFAFDRLQSKIEKCLAIQRSYQTAKDANGRTARGSSRTAHETSGQGGGQAGGQGGDGRVADRFAGIYDAQGILQELVRDGGLGQSTYVLQNERGQITHQIQPAPGVNLHRFLKKKIGVIGQRGFNQQSGLDHVTAQRIVDLNTLRR